MKQLETVAGDAGCYYYGLAANVLNDLIGLAHDNRLTRQQYIMFALADLITQVEVGASLARKAVNLSSVGDREAEKVNAMSRIFACDVAQLAARTAAKILLGSGVFDKDTVSAFFETISYDELICGYRNIIPDMDLVADCLFKRR
jgi:alkylation response protein AidB-like acyl-CoA dehydrogenase